MCQKELVLYIEHCKLGFLLYTIEIRKQHVRLYCHLGRVLPQVIRDTDIVGQIQDSAYVQEVDSIKTECS
jgi:hypothetical protein